MSDLAIHLMAASLANGPALSMSALRQPEAAALKAVIDKGGPRLGDNPRREMNGKLRVPATAIESQIQTVTFYEILEVRGICAILKGAQGRPRGKEWGKRCEHCRAALPPLLPCKSLDLI